MGDARESLVAIASNGALILCAAFFGYVLLIVVPFLRRKRAEPGDGRAFQWHFMIPCLNEEQVIERTVKRLIVDFPGSHVWCIDDGSTDGTGRLLAALAARCSRVHLVTRSLPSARQGKGPALNAGWQALTSSIPAGVDPADVIVGVVDADGRLDVRCTDMVAGPSFFGDPSVGAVQILVRVANAPVGTDRRPRNRLIVRLQDIEFASVIGAVQTFRKHVGSAGMGGNGQFTRLSVLDQIAAEHGTPWKQSLIEDFELGVHVLLSGSRTEYCHDTFVEQEGPSSFRRLVRQRSRWGQGLMQCIRYLPPILRSPNIGNAAALELAYCLLLPWGQLFGGIATVVSLAVLTQAALSLPGGPVEWINSGGWGLLPLFIVFALAPLSVWGPVYRVTVAPELSRRRALALGLANWPYTYVHHIAIWWAFGRILGSRRDWKKTERELDPVTPAHPLIASGVMVPVTASVAESGRRPVPALSRTSTGGEVTPTDDDWEQAVVHYIPRRLRPSSGAAARRPRGRSGPGSNRSVPVAARRDLVSAGASSVPAAHSHKREEK